jgi:hypothetical protein
VPARYSPGGFVKVFTDTRGGLSITVHKASNGSITVYRNRAVRCQLCFSGGFVKVFADARGVVSL